MNSWKAPHRAFDLEFSKLLCPILGMTSDPGLRARFGPKQAPIDLTVTRQRYQNIPSVAAGTDPELDPADPFSVRHMSSSVTSVNLADAC